MKRVYEIIYELEERFPERCFTLDGVSLGRPGEMLAAHGCSLDLLTASTEHNDARTRSGTAGQIKATKKGGWLYEANQTIR